MAANASMSEPLANRVLVAFVLPYVSVSIIGPILYMAPQIFAKHYGYSLITLGAVITFVRLFDALIDPAIGYMSDTSSTRWGNRRPWVVVGGGMMIAAGLSALFLPQMGMAFFAAGYLLFALFRSIFGVPYLAWSTSLTNHYQSRNRLYFFKQWAAVAGGFVLPVLTLPIFGSGEVTPDILRTGFLVGAVILVPALVILARVVPDRTGNYEASQSELPKYLKIDYAAILALFRKNPPFLLFTATRVMSAIGSGAAAGISFIYFDTYLEIGRHYSLISFTSMFGGILALLLGQQIVKFIDRRTVYIWGSLISAVGSAGMFFLTPQTPGLLYWYMGISGITGVFLGTIITTITFSLYADITDYGRLKAKVEGAGVYTSLLNTIQSIEYALLGGVGLLIVGLFGYDPSAASNTDTAVFGLRFVAAVIPGTFALIAALMMFAYPLNQRRMRIITSRINSIQDRAARDLPIPVESKTTV